MIESISDKYHFADDILSPFYHRSLNHGYRLVIPNYSIFKCSITQIVFFQRPWLPEGLEFKTSPELTVTKYMLEFMHR